MFRRKEEGLFDTAEQGHAAYLPGDAPQSAPAASSAAAPAGSPAGGIGAPPSSALPSSLIPSRPATEPRHAPAAAFRPTASPMSSMMTSPLGSDMVRSRAPEPKMTPPPAPGISGGADKSPKAGRRVLTVGNDILLKGEIATCDRLVIEGKVDATLNDVHTVEIAENGSFKGSANIEDAEISGVFEGDLVVRNRLVIYATGKVRGKISYGEIEIERGGELTGEIKIADAQPPAASRPSRATVKEDKVAA